MFHIGSEYGLLGNDIMLSNYVNVQKSISWHLGDVEQTVMQSINQYFSPLTRHQLHQATSLSEITVESANIVLVNHVLKKCEESEYRSMLDRLWSALPKSGLLIVYEDVGGEASVQLNKLLQEKGSITYYSSIAGCKIRDNYDLSQYSELVEENLRREKQEKKNTVRIIQKAG